MEKKIVIVDNDYDTLEIFGEFFEQQGFNVIKIQNISNLINFIENNSTDIIITNANILVNEHESFLKNLKDKIDKIPVLYLTEKNKLQLLESKMQVQEEQMIEKPVFFINLLESVNRELKA